MRLAGKVAVVTGAGGSTGGATAVRLAEEGAKVVINAHRNLKGADRVLELIRYNGGEAVIVQADVTLHDEARKLMRSAVSHFGDLHVLVNNVGGMRGSRFVDLSEQDWDYAQSVNVKSAFFCSQAAAEWMMEHRYGRIINLSSPAMLGSLANANYATAKAAVFGLTKTLALELGPYGITVNCVSPGLINSEIKPVSKELRETVESQTPLGVLVEPEDVANAILFFASDEARRITGQMLHVSAGLDFPLPGTKYR